MKNILHPIALFRLSVLGPLTCCEQLSRGEIKKTIHELSTKCYSIPSSKHTHLSAKTIERWYYAWRKGGIDALEPKIRTDCGSSKLSSVVQQAIVDCKKDNLARSVNTIIDLLKMNHTYLGQLSRSSVHRVLVKHDLAKRIPGNVETIERRAFEAKHAGDIWHGDVLHGPKIQTKKGMKKVYLVSLMDDASRLICHTEFCLDETAISIEHVLKEAILKRGLPKRLIVDNGAAYRSATLQMICARLGIKLIHCRPYEPQGKGKLERWHASFRKLFLSEIKVDSIKSPEELNAKLWIWIEQYYHRRKHSGLNDERTPIERWRQDLLQITPLGDKAPLIDDYFYHREKRKVRKDGTVSYKNCFFEVPFELAQTEIYLVVEPYTQEPKWIESLEFKRIGMAVNLDKIANNGRPRARPSAVTDTGVSQTIHMVDTLYEKIADKFDITKTEEQE